MPRCCGCQGGAVYEPQEDVVNILDVTLLEASETSLKFGFRAPRATTKVPSSSSSSSRNNAVRVGRGPLSFTVSVLGGPYNDVLGNREELISNIRCGACVEHEVSGLQPATEYTIHVGLVLSDHTVIETLEARTGNATTALFAEEDWGRSNATGSKGSKDCGDTKDPAGKEGRETGGASSSSMSPAAASSSAVPSAPPRTDTQDDVSTNAPSEAGEDTGRRFDDHASDHASDSDSEVGQERWEEPVATEAAVVDEDGHDPVTAIEIDGPPKRSIECKFFDCFKLGRGKKPQTSSEEIIVDNTQAAAKPAPKRRGFRPYRPPFPGTPVDPASVGLLPNHSVEVA